MLNLMGLELDETTHARLVGCAERGDTLAQRGDYKAAIQTYYEGWNLLPEPRSQWEASTWILGAIADAAFQGGYLTSARQALDYAMTCPGAIGNPFLHLRRGEVLFEQDELDAAVDELMRAYMGAGSTIFKDEPTKYLEFLRTRADLSV